MKRPKFILIAPFLRSDIGNQDECDSSHDALCWVVNVTEISLPLSSRSASNDALRQAVLEAAAGPDRILPS